MSTYASFVVSESPAGRVRIEAPDVVRSELPGMAPMVCRGWEIRESAAMLVRVYRERHDRAFAGNDEDIVVRFVRDGAAPLVLGPFLHRVGIALGNAIAIARRAVLFAVPGLSVSVASDRSWIVVEASGEASGTGGRITVPVPSTALVQRTCTRASGRSPSRARSAWSRSTRRPRPRSSGRTRRSTRPRPRGATARPSAAA